MNDSKGQRDRSRLYQAMTWWCRRVQESSGLTLASMQGRECRILPCWDFCPYRDQEEGKE